VRCAASRRRCVAALGGRSAQAGTRVGRLPLHQQHRTHQSCDRPRTLRPPPPFALQAARLAAPPPPAAAPTPPWRTTTCTGWSPRCMLRAARRDRVSPRASLVAGCKRGGRRCKRGGRRCQQGGGGMGSRRSLRQYTEHAPITRAMQAFKSGLRCSCLAVAPLHANRP
jgi:hypothetical protein